MTVLHESSSQFSDEFGVYRIDPAPKHDSFRDLAGRHPSEIRGLVQILLAEERAHLDSMALKAMQEAQARNEAAGQPNRAEDVERLLLDYMNHPEHHGPAATSGDGVSDPPPAA